ncbi:MAG: 16S rRNA (guanine(966)-N(2))-methyltransferase RsmD [Selenomonadaceae bacterium]|nr:16S rRNA (guanine(966)-N(2))-methyltransferase RsmD [Selenomonadaceae bacterium]
MRVITGSARGTHLASPKGMDTRPTADRVKESLFNILGNSVAEKNVLDLFAGTGNLGIEALSRGAKSATFIDAVTDKIIRENLKRTHLEDMGEVIKGDVFKTLKRLWQEKRVYDLIFIDPPYFKDLSQKTMDFLNSFRLFSDNSIIVVEYGFKEIFAVYDNLELKREVAYGKTTKIGFFVGKGKND